MWPVLWGHVVWCLRHSGSLWYKQNYPDEIPEAIAKQLEDAVRQLCIYLLCGGCSMHCMQNMVAVPPQTKSGVEFWKWDVDFHNKVNSIKTPPTVQFSYEEAEEALKKKLEKKGLNLDRLEDGFCLEWWAALLLTSKTFTGKPEEATEQEQQRYRDWLASVCFLVPFGHKVLSENDGEPQLCRDVMIKFIYSEKFELTSRKAAFSSLTLLHNEICMHFGVLPKSVEDLTLDFNHALQITPEKYHDLSRAYQIREEDHTKMLAMQKELDEFRAGRDPAISLAKENGDAVSAGYRTATIILGTLLGFLLLLVAGMWIWHRYRHVIKKHSKFYRDKFSERWKTK